MDSRGCRRRPRVSLRAAAGVRAYLTGANLPAFTIVPAAGAFTLFKKAYTTTGHNAPVLVRLTVPEDAKRVSALIGRKCRVSKAIVESMVRVSDKAPVTEARSGHEAEFIYRVGEAVTPREEFNDDIRIECGSGIHGFITSKEAEDYF